MKAASNSPALFKNHPYRWTMLAGVWLVYNSFGVTSISLATLVKPISDDLGLSNTEMGTIIGAWQTVYIATAIPCGALLDRLGPRRCIIIAACLIALSNLLRAVSSDAVSLYLAVATFGLGGPLISIGAPKVIAQWFEGPERGQAMGLYVVGSSLGGISTLSLTNSVWMPLVGGEWRNVFFLFAGWAICMGLIWIAINLHPAPRSAERQEAARPKEPQRRIFLSLIRIPAVRIVLLMSLCTFFFNHGLNAWLPEMLRSRGMSLVEAGFWASVPQIVGLAGALIVPRLATPSRRHLVLCLLFISIGVSTLFIQFGEGMSLAVGLIFQGAARSSLMTVMMLTLSETRGVDARTVGLAGGMFFSVAEIGGVLGPFTLGFASDVSGGFDVPLYVLTGICVTLLLLLSYLRRLDREPT
jgi:CP family cyanate transporter-like MFS transporter